MDESVLFTPIPECVVSPVARQHTSELISTTHTHALQNPDYIMIIIFGC